MKIHILLAVLCCVACQSKRDKNSSSSVSESDILKSKDTIVVALTSSKTNSETLVEPKAIKRTNTPTVVTPESKDFKVTVQLTDKPVDIITFSKFVDSTYVVKLETNTKCLIGNISKLKIYNDRIFILDRTSKQLLEFDMQGKFIRLFGKKGKGPGEYLNPSTFDINKKTQELVIYDASRRQLLSYSLKEGVYKDAKKLKYRIGNFVFGKNYNTYIFDTHLVKHRKAQDNVPYYSLAVANLEGDIQTQLFQTDKAQNSLSYRSRNNIFKSESAILFNQPFTNCIYKITETGYTPFFKLEFNERTIPKGLDHNIEFMEFNKKLKANGYQYFDNASGYYMFRDKLLFTVKRKDIHETYVYNMSLNTLKLLKPTTDNLSFGFLGTKACAYGDYLVNYASPFMFLDEKQYKSEAYAGTETQRIVNVTKEGDNPILIFNRVSVN